MTETKDKPEPGQEDHEAASEIARKCQHPTDAGTVPCLSCIAAALSEAVRVAVEGERERHTSMAEGDHFCRQCERLSAQTVIDSMRSDAQATPAPEPLRHSRDCDSWTMDAVKQRRLQCNCTPEVIRGTPPETGEK